MKNIRKYFYAGYRIPGLLCFTLIELLVVIAIIAVITSLLLPTLTRAKEAARKVACMNNMKNVGLGFNTYKEDFDSFPRPNHWLDDFRPVYSYVKNLNSFLCPSSHNPQLTSTEDLDGGTDFLFITLKDFPDIERNDNENAGLGNNPYNFDPSNPQAPKIAAGKTAYLCLYDRSYLNHRGWINVVYLNDLHYEDSYGVSGFWYLNNAGNIIKELTAFPCMD